MESQDNLDRRVIDQARFRVDTTINVAHILTTVAMVMAIFSWGSELKAAVQRHESEIQEVKTSLREDRAALRDELRELNRKIDRLVDRSIEAVQK